MSKSCLTSLKVHTSIFYSQSTEAKSTDPAELLLSLSTTSKSKKEEHDSSLLGIFLVSLRSIITSRKSREEQHVADAVGGLLKLGIKTKKKKKKAPGNSFGTKYLNYFPSKRGYATT